MGAIVVSAGQAGKTCPYCRFPLKEGAAAEQCGACSTLHHAECWADGHGCSVLGCANANSFTPPVPTQPTVVVRAVEPPTPAGRRRWPLWAGIVAAVLVAGGIGAAVVVAVSGGSSDTTTREVTQPGGAPGSPGGTTSSSSDGLAAAKISPYLRKIDRRQQTVVVHIRRLRPGVRSFRGLRVAGGALGATISRVQGALDGIAAAGAEDRRVLGATRRALGLHTVYVDRLQAMPDLPRAFTTGQAAAIIAAADRTEDAYVQLGSTDASLPAVTMAAADHRHLLEVVPLPVPVGTSCHDRNGNTRPVSPPAGIPRVVPAYFASCDRQELCLVTNDFVKCSAVPSGNAVRLQAGVGVRPDTASAVDHGGYSMPEGTSFRTPNGQIECDSSSHGITCREKVSGHSFRIADLHMSLDGVPY
jgi:hypothetical protein